MNVKRTYTVTDHNDDFVTYVKVKDVKGVNRDFPMDYVEEVLVSSFEDGPYVELTVKFFLGPRKDICFVLDSESLEVLEYELKKFKGKDLFFYKRKPTELCHKEPEVPLSDAPVIDRRTENSMTVVYLSGIKSITLKDGEMVVRYYGKDEKIK